MANITTFAADGVTSITLSEGDVNSIITDDALAADSVLVGAVTATSQAQVLANGDKFADNGITSIQLTNAELEKFIVTDSIGANPFAAASITLGAVIGNQATVVSNIAKVVTGGISAITLNATQYDTISASASNLQDGALTLAVENGEAFNFSLDANLDAKLTTASVGAGGALTVSADQANSITMTGDGNLTVTGVDAITNLANVATSLTLTSTLATDVDISGNASNLSSVDNFSIDTDVGVTMTIVQNSKISAAAGDNTVTLSANGTATGNASVETYNLAAGANNFATANVSQTVVGNTGIDEITAGSGNDILIGSGGADVLIGGLGTDRIIGGTSEDILTGGGGADTFVITTGDTGTTDLTKDTITDFETGIDILEFDVTSGAALSYTAVNAGTSGVDPLRMFGDEFIATAETAFGTGTNVYFAAAIGGTTNGYLAVDIDGDGAFDAGTDVFIQLNGLSSTDDLAATQINFV